MSDQIPQAIIRKPLPKKDNGDRPFIKVEKTVFPENNNNPIQQTPPPVPGVDEITDFKKNLEKTTSVESQDSPKLQQENFTIDFMNEEHIKNQVKQPTTESQAPLQNGTTIQQAQNNIMASEMSGEAWTYDDYKMMASFLIELFDTGLTLACRVIAKDNTDTPYQVKNEKKEMLIKSLTHILIKYQKRAKIEFLFIATLILVYVAPFRKAFERRRELKKQEAAKPPVKMEVIQQKREYVKKEDKKEEEKTEENKDNLFPLKRKRGGQPK